MLSKEELLNDFEVIANNSDKNQKLTFDRRYNKLQGLLEQILPIDNEINELMVKKMPISEEINELREQMLGECIHPERFLIHHTSHIECKFCNTKLVVNKSFP
mgnify:CR=1 FL=1